MHIFANRRRVLFVYFPTGMCKFLFRNRGDNVHDAFLTDIRIYYGNLLRKCMIGYGFNVGENFPK